MSLDRALLLFARLPRLGRVKTRLCPEFTEQEALALHRALLADSLDLLHRGAHSSSAKPFLYLSEAGALDPELAREAREAQVAIQKGDDLGERLAHAFQEQFGTGMRRVVVLGSDSPHLPCQRVERAFAELDSNEMVLGPARDGGYYLIGATRLHPPLYRGISWGTRQVYRETVKKARKAGIPLASLPAWNDVDVPEAVQQLWKDILHLEEIGSGEMPRHTRQLLKDWQRQGRRL